MGLRMQPHNERFSPSSSVAGSNAVESAAILVEFAAAPCAPKHGPGNTHHNTVSYPTPSIRHERATSGRFGRSSLTFISLCPERGDVPHPGNVHRWCVFYGSRALLYAHRGDKRLRLRQIGRLAVMQDRWCPLLPRPWARPPTVPLLLLRRARRMRSLPRSRRSRGSAG